MALSTFYIFSALTLGAALLVLFTKNIMYMALGLFVALLGVAALFVLMGADFLAVTQLLIYVGGILILILFGVMLSQRRKSIDSQGDNKINTSHQNQWLGGIVALSVFGFLGYLVLNIKQNNPVLALPKSTVQQFGMAFLTSHILPFELAGILLLMVLVGAGYLAYFKS